MTDCWDILGIEPTADRRDIRRAYAGRLKTLGFEAETSGFQALRGAYEEASGLASRWQDAGIEPGRARLADLLDDVFEPAEEEVVEATPHPAEEPHRQDLAALADEAIGAALGAGASGSAKILAQFLARPALESIADKERFERIFLERLLDARPVRWHLFDAATEVFRWHENLWPLTWTAPVLAARAQRQIQFRFGTAPEDWEMLSAALAAFESGKRGDPEAVPLGRYVATRTLLDLLASEQRREIQERAGHDLEGLIAWWRGRQIARPAGAAQAENAAASGGGAPAMPEAASDTARFPMRLLLSNLLRPWWMIFLLPVTILATAGIACNRHLDRRLENYPAAWRFVHRLARLLTPRRMIAVALFIAVARCAVDVLTGQVPLR